MTLPSLPGPILAMEGLVWGPGCRAVCPSQDAHRKATGQAWPSLSGHATGSHTRALEPASLLGFSPGWPWSSQSQPAMQAALSSTLPAHTALLASQVSCRQGWAPLQVAPPISRTWTLMDSFCAQSQDLDPDVTWTICSHGAHVGVVRVEGARGCQGGTVEVMAQWRWQMGTSQLRGSHSQAALGPGPVLRRSADY